MLATCGDVLHPKTGRGRPQQQTTISDVSCINDFVSNHDASAVPVVAHKRGSLAGWVSRASVPAAVAVISRRLWLHVLAVWAASPVGAGVLAGRVKPSVFLAVAGAYARHGNGSTGRGICVSGETIAEETGFSRRTVSTVRAILIEAGLLWRSAGGVPSRSGKHNKPAVDHLVASRELIAAAAVDNSTRRNRGRRRTCARPRSTYLGNKSSVSYVVTKAPAHGSPSTSTDRSAPTARPRSSVPGARARKSPIQRRRWCAAYRIADVLCERLHGYGIADRALVACALYRSGLDLHAWMAYGGPAALASALNVHAPATTTRSGWTQRWDWPDHIGSPGGFLASRLTHLPAAPQTTPTCTPAAEVIAQYGPGSSDTARQLARAELAADLATKAARRRDLVLAETCPVCGGEPVPAELHCRRCQKLLTHPATGRRDTADIHQRREVC